ncbi:MAG: LytTR family DNA-binding domain-containing protein [Cyclobacteriaceae bacterium]
MKALIIEDEPIAAERLASMITDIRPGYEILGQLDSIDESIQWLSKKQLPDVIFLDIHLADGNSFEIFKSVQVDVPVIFTTAYDQYAIKAFKVNSIDYLLKPIDKEGLEAAMKKLEKNREMVTQPAVLQNLDKLVQSLSRPYKSRFVIKVGEHLHAIETQNIYFFYSEEKATFLQTNEGKKYIIDYPLDQVESMVDPEQYFRISRKYIVSFEAIKDMLSHSNSRLRLVLHNCTDSEVIVSRERVNDFKKWLDN